MDERFGFIHEKLDIKLLILFVLRRLPAPIDAESLADLVLIDGGIGYFDYKECLAELVNTAIETVVDLVSPEFHPLAGRAKDIAAAAVWVLSLMVALVGLAVFANALLARL